MDRILFNENIQLFQSPDSSVIWKVFMFLDLFKVQKNQTNLAGSHAHPKEPSQGTTA
jgi:hypothetical protein